MSNYATLRIPLTNDIPVNALKTIIEIADDIYINNVWLSKAENYHFENIPDDYNPLEYGDWLRVQKLEIGTPNFVELLGLSEYMLPVVAFFGAVLGGTKLTFEVINSGLDSIKNISEIEKIGLESDKLKLEIARMKREAIPTEIIKEVVNIDNLPNGFMDKTNKLYEQGRISYNIYNYKKDQNQKHIQMSHTIESYTRKDEDIALTHYIF